MNLIYITGTSKGIGNALALELLNDLSNKVVGISRSQSIQHSNYIHFNIDLGDLEQLKTFKFKIPPGVKKVVLVNNAGSLGEVNYTGSFSAEMISQTMNINLVSPMILANEFIKAYQDAAVPKLIINITSGAANTAYDGWSMYCTAKAGIDMFTKVIEREQQHKKHAVKILGIAPGVVDTDLQEQILKTKVENFSQKQKFVDLRNNNQLYSAVDVAKKLASIIKEPQSIGNTISRLNF
jgi:benzil reductase ((S)-benzoin forming)